MKRIIAFLLTILTIGLFSCEKDNTGKDLTILSQIMKPLNYIENGQLKGISVETVQGIQNLLGLENTIEAIDNWDSIYNRLKTEENIAVITTALTAERKGLFKWVGPVSLLHTGFITLQSSNLVITQIADARNLAGVGIIKSSVTEETLLDLGFTNLVEFLNEEALVSGLYSGSVEVVFDMYSLIQIAAQDKGLDESQLNFQLVQNSTHTYIAFSDDVSDKVISKWQRALNEMKDNGSLQTIYDTYLPGSKAPGRISIFTERNPPQNFVGSSDGILKGSSVEMVQAMMEEMEVDYPITCTSWDIAFSQIQFVPNAMTFSTARTAARESQYKWVGPVCKKSYVFYVRADSDIHITTTDDAKTLNSVGTVTGWATAETLASNGFTNVVTWDQSWDVLEKLCHGEVDCIVLNDIGITWLLTKIGHTPEEIRQEATLSSAETYLAFSIDTDKKYIDECQAAYDAIVANGKLLEIWNDWFPYKEWD
ncbi:MAG: transporter substrate-binding domain-containing protein [Bacteroidota bacterium]